MHADVHLWFVSMQKSVFVTSQLMKTLSGYIKGTLWRNNKKDRYFHLIIEFMETLKELQKILLVRVFKFIPLLPVQTHICCTEMK